jgi:UDP-N-acetylglucosamine 4,6-dehydratase
VRYGNVVGSRGSVIPLFKAQASTGVVTITDERMTRFWITLDQTVRFVLDSLPMAGGGEVFVPKIPSMRITDIVDAIAPGAERRVIGIRPGEKLHEVLVTEDESRHSFDLPDRYVILPEYASWQMRPVLGGTRMAPGFRFASDDNERWLTVEELRDMAAEVKAVA